MKKLFSVFVCLLLTAYFAFPVLAGDYDLAKAENADMAAFAEEVRGGRRLFDMCGALSDGEAKELNDDLRRLEEEYGQMQVVVLVENQEISSDLHAYADHIYTAGSLGSGSGNDGAVLVLDLGDADHRGVGIYAQEGAMRFLTDKATDQIYDEYHGGMMTPLAEGDYYAALTLYADALEELYRQGVQSGQYNYDPETGEKDYYKAPRQVKLWHVLVSLLAAGICAWLPVASTRRKYAMTAEKRQAQYVNLAYRQNAVFAYAGLADTLINKHTVHIPIPKQDSDHNGGGGSGFGGGQSTMHRSGGGGHHTYSGRKF